MSVAGVGYFPSAQLVQGEVRPQVFNGQNEKKAEERADNNRTENRNNRSQVINSTAADLERIGLVFNKKLQFVLDHSSQEVIVKVIDKETDKVIKELPPEELQRMHTDLKEVIGFLFDERV